MMTKIFILIVLSALSFQLFSACDSKDKGIGPVSKVELKPFDNVLASKGKDVFDKNCLICHRFDKEFTGPNLTGITKIRTPEFIMNMILNPEGMEKENETIKELAKKYPMRMKTQNISEPDARAILEYLRKIDGN
mgnify:CR=1 FL=1